MSRWKNLGVLPAVAVLVGLLTNSVAAVVIDDFSVGPVSLNAQTTWVNHVQTGLDPDAVAGGSRHFAIRSTGGTIGTQLELDPPRGELRFSSDPLEFGYLDLTYGEEQPLGLDLTAGGANRLVMRFSEVVNTSPGSYFSGKLTVWSGTGASEVGRILSLNGVNESGDFVMPFSHFDPVDFTDVSKISINVLRYYPGSHFTLSQIATIPEPMAIGIAGIGAWCLLGGPTRHYRRSALIWKQ